MPPMHVLLSELERAAGTRGEVTILSDMDEVELRTMLLRVVEQYQARLADPFSYMRLLVHEAQEKHADLVEAREHLVDARARFLETLLEIVTPAVPALLGPVTENYYKIKGQNDRRSEHALLRGFELVDGRRRGSVGAKQFKITGRSWWIVTLTPEEKSDEVRPRYACVEYDGEADDESETWTATIDLCTPEDVAANIGESAKVKTKVDVSWNGGGGYEKQKDPLEVLVGSVLSRIRSAGSDRTAGLTQQTWDSIALVEQALKVMRGEP